MAEDTTKYPFYHGIRLAPNSFFQNLNIESLDSDPDANDSTEGVAGRIWYNSEENYHKTFVSEIDPDTSTETLVVRTLGTKELLEQFVSELNAKILRLENSFRFIQTIDGGVDENTPFDLSTLYASADDISVGDYYRVGNSGWFVQESGVGTPFYANSNDGIIYKDDKNVQIIDNTNSKVSSLDSAVVITGSEDDGFRIALSEAFKQKIQDNLDEINRIETAAGLDSSGNYVANTSANYIGIATALNNADDLLDQAIKSLADDLEQEKVNRGESNDTIRQDYNAKLFTYESTVAAKVHSITHNLDTTTIFTNVWAFDESDSTWNKELPLETMTSDNELTVAFTVERNVRVAIFSPVSL